MRVSRNALVPAALFALCVAAGWLAGRANPQSGPATGSAETGAKEAKTARAPARSAVPAEVQAMLEPLRSARNTEDRLRATIQLAQNIPVRDIPKWLEKGWFSGGEDMQGSLFQRTLLARFQEADPGAMLEFCIRKEIRITFEFAGEWAKRDPVAALALIEKHTDPSRRASLLSYMGEKLAVADPQLMLSRIPDLAAAGSGPDPLDSYYIRSLIGKLASAAPGLLQAQSATWPAELREMVDQGLASASLKRDLRGGLGELARREGGLGLLKRMFDQDGDLGRQIARDPSSLPEGWLGQLVSGGSFGYYLTEADPAKWFSDDVASLGLSEQQLQQLRSSALSHLAGQDPAKLKALLAGDGIAKELRMNAISNLLSRMKQEEAEEWIAGLGSEEEANYARRNLASQEIQRKAGSMRPDDFLNFLAEGDPNAAYSASRAAKRWDQEKLQDLSDGFAALPADRKQAIGMKVLQNSYDGFPTAFQAQVLGFMMANPAAGKAEDDGRSGDPFGRNNAQDHLIQGASNLAAKWADEDPTAAAAWVGGLPSGESRLWAAKNLAARWNEYEPQATRRWMSSLPAAERTAVEAYLKSGSGNGR